jgi:hypothetical protein
MKLNAVSKGGSACLIFLMGVASFLTTMSFASGQDDVSYTRRLADYGYFELARHNLDQIRNREDVPQGLKSYLPVLSSYISMRKSERSEDLLSQVKGIEEALADLKTFVDGHSNHPRILDARRTYSETLRKAAKLWKRILQETPDKADNAFKKARNHLQEAVKVYGTLASSSSVGDDFEVCKLKLDQTIVRHELNRLHMVAGNTNKRLKLLKNVLGSLGDYLWSDCAANHDLLKMRARTYSALTNLELSEVQEKKGNTQKAKSFQSDAETYFNSVVTLIDTLKKRDPAEINQATFEVVNNLVLRAYKNWVQLFHEGNEIQAALTKIGELQSKYANWSHPFQRGPVRPIGFEPGRELLLIKANILWDQGTRQEAIKLVKRISNQDGQAAEEAEELVEKWSESLGPDPLTMQELLNRVDEHVAGSSFYDALEFVRAGLNRINSQEESIRWTWRFLDRKALVYAKMERWYEAAQLYAHIHNRFHDVLSLPLERDNKNERTRVEQILKNDSNDFQTFRDLVLKANYQAARSYGMLRDKTGFSEDEQRYQDLLDHLSNEHSESTWARRTVVLAGKLLREKGQYDQAIERYKGAEKGTEVWEMARIGAALTYYQKGKSLGESEAEKARSAYLNAVDELNALLSYLRELSGLSEAQKGRAWSALNIAAIAYLRKPVDQPDKVLELLSSRTLSQFNVTGENRAKAYKHRMDAWIQKGNSEKVASVAEKLYSDYPETSASVSALGDAASYFESKRKSASSEENRKAYHEQEIAFYYRWIERKLLTGVSGQNALAVSIKLLEYGMERGDQTSLDRARVLLTALRNGEFEGETIRLTGKPVEVEVVKEQLARVHTQLGNLERASSLYDELLDEGGTTLSVLLGRAQLYIQQMKQAKDNEDRETLKELANEGEGFISSRLKDAAEENSETWYRAWKLIAEVKLVSGLDQQGARFIFERLRDSGDNPFGGNVDMFKELLERYPDKMGNLQVTN